ncbi:divergent polysaccharide deacetylase family protein [Shimia sp. FJ5]|uniref:divergent polysaccharide deacetylase family protein n=1 Tax=Shimia sp. FJ5 TaxID=3079054 RepID=UPI00262B2677|nr:divergent polysaccharide deacteylase family protein [Shimia sp. FJ5]MDV4145641.1 divergent polysaccharide deacetylase family protein [Shimia sp. FJ5]
MFRGFLGGVIWGGVFVSLVVAVASLLAPLPATVAPQTSAVETTTGSDKEDTGGIESPSQADESLGGDAGGTVEAEASEDDDSPLADTASAPKPDPAVPQDSLTAPDLETSESGLGGEGDAENPVIPAPQARAPEAPEAEVAALPEAEAEASITTNPDQPAAPTVPAVGSAFETPEGDADLTPGAEADEVGNDTPAPLMQPAGTLEESFPQHKSSRLPTVGDEGADEAAPRPFDVNAVAFEAEGGKPLMSIVLVDDGSAPVDVTAFTDFPYPLSFAINTLAPDAAAREAAYREMGFETLAMVDIPAAAAPADVEIAMEAHLKAMPGAVAVMEGGEDGLQGARALSDQVAQVLLASGHGLVMFPNGLNTAQKLASREGVPAATVFRDFDGKGQNATVIRRFLDQAAFKADQEGGVIMVGRVREETLSALLVWGIQDRARTVALAPVSAVLRAKEN